MWWENLDVLAVLHRVHTMSRAARELGVDKATVSRRIAELERSAPAALFERRVGQIELTPYGTRALSAYAEHERARQRLASALEDTETELTGAVRLTVPMFLASTLIVPALQEFMCAHPQLRVEIDGTDDFRDLTRAEADVAIRSRRPREGGLDVRKIGQLGVAMFASRAYLARRGGLVAPRMLAGHDFLCHDTGPYAGPQFEWLPQAARAARIAFCANDALSVREAARAGLGLAALPHHLGDEAPELVRVLGGGEGTADLWLVTRAEQRRVQRIRALVRFVTELVRAHQKRLCAPSSDEQVTSNC